MAKESEEAAWPALHVELCPIDQLVPNENNARQHTAEDIDLLARSFQTFGFTLPILAVRKTKRVIAGHAKLAAATKLGLERVPVIFADGWTDEQIRAYAIFDNRSAERATWDKPILSKELLDLASTNFDLTILGWDPPDLAELMAPDPTLGLADEDSVPETEERVVAEPGDLFVLGRHRIKCGDATDPTTVADALGDLLAKLMVTDPPYGVEYDPSWREGADLGVGRRSKGKVRNDDRADWTPAWEHFPGDVAYVYHGGLHADVVGQSLKAAGFEIRAQIIWVKHHHALSRGDYHWKHEPIDYAVRKGKPSGWQGGRKQTTVWEIANNNSFGNARREQTWGHGTQKPVECMRRPIINNTRPGDVVYDPFLGSGGTVIAAESTGRTCVGLEIEPAYVDVIIKRWQQFTGKQAVHVASGMTFDERARAKAGEGHHATT
jgi:DNA modification methylase